MRPVTQSKFYFYREMDPVGDRGHISHMGPLLLREINFDPSMD